MAAVNAPTGGDAAAAAAVLLLSAHVLRRAACCCCRCSLPCRPPTADARRFDCCCDAVNPAGISCVIKLPRRALMSLVSCSSCARVCPVRCVNADTG